jgi:hypothetical protein
MFDQYSDTRLEMEEIYRVLVEKMNETVKILTLSGYDNVEKKHV